MKKLFALAVISLTALVSCDPDKNDAQQVELETVAKQEFKCPPPKVAKEKINKSDLY